MSILEKDIFDEDHEADVDVDITAFDIPECRRHIAWNVVGNIPEVEVVGRAGENNRDGFICFRPVNVCA